VKLLSDFVFVFVIVIIFGIDWLCLGSLEERRMKVTAFGLVGLWCGVALAHDYLHQYINTEIPLHKQEFEQASNEELERKWGFEVCSNFLRFVVVSDDLRRALRK